jgi:hypothetical protein
MLDVRSVGLNFLPVFSVLLPLQAAIAIVMAIAYIYNKV